VLAGALLLTACDGGSREPRSGPERVAETSTPLPADAGETATLTLAFAGDVHFEGGFTGLPGWDRATLGPMSPALRDADLAMVNLEAALTDTGSPTRKEREVAGNRYWFRAPASALDLLERSGVDVVTVANNHGADYGLAGLRRTVEIGGDAPLGVVGVGADAAAAFAPHRVTIRGTDVAVLAADASPRESADAVWAARPGSGPGLASARGDDHGQLLAAVRAAAAVDDLVVVYLHWGAEGETCPTGGQEALAAALAEAGADVVVGTHAHRLQGAGRTSDGAAYVAYGLGNFFWYHGREEDTGVLRLRVRDGEVLTDTWLPGRIRPAGGNPQPLTGRERSRADAEFRDLRSCTSLAPGPSEAVRGTSPQPAPLPEFEAQVRPIGAALAARMRGTSIRPGCPVPLADLRHLTVSYVDTAGAARTGGMVVAAEVADDVVTVLGRLYDARFPIARMRPIEAYGGDDDRSMAAGNSSAFNCRAVAGSTTLSDHAYGRAIDLNPVQNPYVTAAGVLPPAGAAWVDRAAVADDPRVVSADDVVVRAFAEVGWEWGGTWTEPDYQHFYAP
jgi:poly-gamma-glutamate synthesis protein (capsule biosynthesis protein)